MTADPLSGLRARAAALTPRERLFLAGGAVALLLFILYFLLPTNEADEVELVATPPPAAQPVFVPPPAAPPPPVAAMPAAPVADPSAVTSLTLRGVMGGGASGGAAIVSGADNVQRVVRAGRELAPGIILRRVGVNYAIASSGAGEIRLELNKTGGVAIAAAAPAAAPAAAAPTSVSAQRETIELRLGLQPMRTNGRISGFAVKPGAVPQRLQRAGLRPGDVILRVNGSELDEERLMDLSWELSNSERTEFEYLRGGQRMKASLQP